MKYMYLDGKTKSKVRMDMVKEFNEGDAEVFLISLKAGGAGLNLTGADIVIHFDPWWNPAVEEQATDRAHRIGQQKTVEVIKLLTKGTIEEKIYNLQEKKKEMIKNVMDEDMNEDNIITQMTQEDLESLFV
jgi:SNF2 family DNA or RNA helicase